MRRSGRDGDDSGRQGDRWRRSRTSCGYGSRRSPTPGVRPGLGTVLVGDDPGSQAYVDGKHRDCAEVGIASIRRDLPADATQAEVEAVVAELNADPACTGYIVQLPLPRRDSTSSGCWSGSTRTRTPTGCTR